jgi:hypothetical protein
MKKTLLSIATVLGWIYLASAIPQDDSRTIRSVYLKSDVPLTADLNSKEWKSVEGVTAERGPRGELTPGHKTEIRSRWRDNNLYLLFICHFEQLYLKPNPSTTTETARLWDWDVAEVFIGSDFQNIKRYREFQVSPPRRMGGSGYRSQPDSAQPQHAMKFRLSGQGTDRREE